MIYGYARVSSNGQKKDGTSLDDQRAQLTALGAQIIVEECFSGTTVHRPKFEELLGKLKAGDTLIVTKYDRFARTVSEGAALIKQLVELGIIVNIANMGVAQNTPTGMLMVQILLAFAEYERNIIVERTQAGKAIARQKPDYREGRPRKFSVAQVDHAMELLKVHSYNQVADMTGISKSTLLRAKKRKKQQNQ